MENKNWAFVKVFQEAIERAKKLQQGAVIGSVCPNCGNDNIGDDGEYLYCLNKDCLNVWAK